MDLRAASHRVSPALVGSQRSGRDHLEPTVVRIATAHRRTHVALAVQGANRHAHLTPVPQQRRGQLRTQIA